MVSFFADLLQNSLWIVNSTINLRKKLLGSWSGHQSTAYLSHKLPYCCFSCTLTLLSLKSLWKALSWGMWSKWNLLLTVQIFTQILLLQAQHYWQKALRFSQWELWRKATGIILILASFVCNSCCSLAAKGEGNFGEEKWTWMLTLLLHLFWRDADAVSKRK